MKNIYVNFKEDTGEMKKPLKAAASDSASAIRNQLHQRESPARHVDLRGEKTWSPSPGSSPVNGCLDFHH